MAIANTGVIALTDIVAEFGGDAPHALSEYYGVAAGVPGSGTIRFSDFYGTSSDISEGLTVIIAQSGDFIVTQDERFLVTQN